MIDFYSLYSIIKLIRTISPKIVHTFDTKPGLIGRLAARICSVPIIIGTLPGLGVLYSSEKKLIRMFRLFYQFVIKIVCELSTSTVFQNPDDRKLFLEKGIIKDSNSQIILGSGIDTNYFSMEKLKSSNLRKIRKSIGCENDDIVVTMVTRIIRSNWSLNKKTKLYKVWIPLEDIWNLSYDDVCLYASSKEIFSIFKF